MTDPEQTPPTAAHTALLNRLLALPTGTVFGIQGAQGSGKSTLARWLAARLQAQGLAVAVLSLDDGYLTRRDRQQLAAEVHPLLATRGVPGSHDVALLRTTLQRLRAAGPASRIALPRFDKASDERLPQDQWPVHEGPVDRILFEGWCLAAPPQAPSALAEPVNDLERREDPDGRWRAYVNQQLAAVYPALWAELDHWLVLQAPSFATVYDWRRQQEQALRAEAQAAGRPCHGLMDDSMLARFIQHYERLTRHCLQVLPQQADGVWELDAQRRIVADHWREAP